MDPVWTGMVTPNESALSEVMGQLPQDELFSAPQVGCGIAEGR